MNPHLTEWLWLDPLETVSMAELSRACGLSAAELDELIDYGALAPCVQRQPSARSFDVTELAPADLFGADCITRLRTVASLRLHYDLDLFSMGMMLGYLTRIEELEQQLASLVAQAPIAAEPGLRGGYEN